MATDTQPTSLIEALGHFEVAEANLIKLENLSKEIKKKIPEGVAFFGSDYDYDDKCCSYENIISQLPKINNWKPDAMPLGLNEIAQNRLDAQDVGDLDCLVSVEERIDLPNKQIAKYRFLLRDRRCELINDSLNQLIDLVDKKIREIQKKLLSNKSENEQNISADDWQKLEDSISQIDTLLGSSIKRPQRWYDLHRHLHFAELNDFNDIEKFDWPVVKKYIRDNMYAENQAIPSTIDSLDELVNEKPTGSVARGLNWKKLTPEKFERLIFSLISSEEGYENPQWLTQTNAPDRGRDLSVNRKISDSLMGTKVDRVIIQCKHWLKNSISIDEIAKLKEQMKLWEPPKVDIHIIVTTGRFTSDAISCIEKHNNESYQSLRIEMWPETHLEMLLASRPNLIAEFDLRSG